jgi:hypothetical protein
MAAGNVSGSFGPVAQLVEHLHGMEGVARSSRVGSTLETLRATSPTPSRWALGGIVAGEGCFSVTRSTPEPRIDGSVRLRFVFSLTMATRDRDVVEALAHVVGVGSIRRIPPRQVSHLEQVCYTVNSRRAHFSATIPFMEQYLLPSAKRDQFERWRDALIEHERAHPSKYGKGPSPCSEPGCEKPVRGRGLCRSHYYRATGY